MKHQTRLAPVVLLVAAAIVTAPGPALSQDGGGVPVATVDIKLNTTLRITGNRAAIDTGVTVVCHATYSNFLGDYDTHQSAIVEVVPVGPPPPAAGGGIPVSLTLEGVERDAGRVNVSCHALRADNAGERRFADRGVSFSPADTGTCATVYGYVRLEEGSVVDADLQQACATR